MTNRHADLIRQYCEIWVDDPKPWKRLEWSKGDGEWELCTTPPVFHFDLEYRIIPEQITIAGITFDAPLTVEPEEGCVIFYPSNTSMDGSCFTEDFWYSHPHQKLKLKAGGCFATPEAAAACARAYSKLVGGEV
jgi:hypothetical protein